MASRGKVLVYYLGPSWTMKTMELDGPVSSQAGKQNHSNVSIGEKKQRVSTILTNIINLK